MEPTNMTKPSQQDTANLTDILERYEPDRSNLIPMLQDVQDRLGYLSESAVDEMAERIGLSPNEIYAVATFYTQFRFSPPGEHTIQICQGTACHVRGAAHILTKLQQTLGITAGQTTSDGRFDLQRVACLGCCALAPVVAIDGHIYAEVTPKKIPAILARYSQERKTANV